MTARQLLFNDNGALRALWRLLIFAAATIASFVVAESIVGPIIARLFRLIGVQGVSSEAWVETAAVFGGTVVALRWVDKRPWRYVWLGRDAAHPPFWLFGFAVGTLAIGVPILFLIAGDWLRQTPGGGGSWAAAALRTSGGLTTAISLLPLPTPQCRLSQP